jgi:phosphoglycolate phosphatase-like HAD superfamily hydrolase
MKKIRAILFDMIGTTVLEKDPTVINSCFEKAFLHHGITIDGTQVRSVRGMDKMEAIEVILKLSDKPLEMKSQIFESFKSNVQKNTSNFEEHPELNLVISQLRERKIVIGIASGLPLVLFQMLFKKFGWQKYSFDYVNVYESFPEGRPNPAMIFDMCKKFQLDAGQLLKVGDTIVDIEEGKNAGSITAAVLVGTQSDATLLKAKPNFILKSLSDVVSILN